MVLMEIFEKVGNSPRSPEVSSRRVTHTHCLYTPCPRPFYHRFSISAVVH
jgi:hypothetical protein